jgi:hypothetical protein
MPQPNSPNIVSTPSHPGQPYDAEDQGAVGKWDKLDADGGPADIHDGRVTGDFPDSPPWRQV